MKTAVEVMDVLSDSLSKELLASGGSDIEVDIKLATSFIRLYFEMIDAGNEIVEEYENALEALNEYSFTMMQVGHSGYTALMVRMTILAEKMAETHAKDESASSMTDKEIQLYLFGGAGEQ